MNSNNEIEEPTLASAVPQSNSMETETTSVSSTNDNYTPNETQNQATSNNSSKHQIPNFFDSKGHFKHSVFAQFANIQRFNGTNHIYKGSTTGIYVCDDELIQFAIQQFVTRFNFSQAKEEVKQLSIATKMSERTESPSNFVGFANGVYDINTSDFKEFKDCTPADFILTNKLSVDYSPNIPTSNEPVDTLINKVTGYDPKLRIVCMGSFGSLFMQM